MGIDKKKFDFGIGDRDAVLRELIKHDNSHMGPSLVNKSRVQYWSEALDAIPRGINFCVVIYKI